MRFSSVNTNSALWAAALVIAMLCPAPAFAKLFSASTQESRAQEIIDQVLRETRLADGTSFWGEQNRDEIERTTMLFKTSFYSIFFDMRLNAAMARCVVSAKYDPDLTLWQSRMNQFDRAAMELDQKDRARYFFAKGLSQLQIIGTKLRLLPTDFFTAAEYGQSSEEWAEYIVKANSYTASVGNEQIGAVLARFGESYARGGFNLEAYKMYLLALRSGSSDADLFVKLVECADRGGSAKLAYKSSLLFLNSYSVPDGRLASRGAIDSLRISARMPAYDVWQVCETGAIDAALRMAPPARGKTDSPLKERQLSRFDGRYAQPIIKSLGMYDDGFEAALCEQYWADSNLVHMYVMRVGSGIDALDGIVARLAKRVREDSRFTQSKELALWEARRWKDAGRLEEFQSTHPDRYALSGMGSN